ncbi:hAT family dimerization protein [Rhizoctonia solani 123E]|uniref:HAT family dimerization protein n=1 Tax=Rhizoctonia solani 123E TaxID=1423351 RepID=A0A074SG88_9AGAM|nr:hAT family dimerization protein [Rhizoctonia solani 123E]
MAISLTCLPAGFPHGPPGRLSGRWVGNDTTGTVNPVEFWKAHRDIFPLLYQIAINIPPVRASSVSSQRAFSSSKMTCTRERNNISPEHMVHLKCSSIHCIVAE